MKRFILFAFVILLFSHLLPAQDNKVEKWDVYEISLPGPSAPNPFVGIELSAVFKNGDRTFEPEGFYDGNGIFKIRFMPDKEGKSTILEALSKGLFDRSSSRAEAIKCVKPLTAPGNVTSTVTIEFTLNKTRYRVEKNFNLRRGTSAGKGSDRGSRPFCHRVQTESL